MAQKRTKKTGASKMQLKQLSPLSEKRLSEMVSTARDLALASELRNLRVRAEQHLIPLKPSRTQ